MKSRDTLAIFNRGIVDRRALARVDVTRVALSAEEQTNFIPRVLGSMSLRPGTRYRGNSADDAAGVKIPFVFSRTDTAIIEITPSKTRIWDDGDTLISANIVSATIDNGTFDTDLADWTSADETGAASSFAAGGYMQLLGTRFDEARRRQSVSITETATEHRLRVTIERGPVLIRIGTSAGADDVFTQAVLRTGTHSLAFTPGAATIHIEFASSLKYPVLVDSVAFESSGTVELPSPWSTLSDCRAVRWQRVGDVVFVAADGYQQRRIERRANNSWSLVLYEADDGPFIGPNTDGTRITPSALSGAITLTSSRPLFRSSSLGQIYRMTSQGQKVEVSVSSEDTFSDDIRVVGTGSQRTFTITRAGTWTATVTLQRSDGETGNFVDVTTFTTNGSASFTDTLDNSISFYRIGVKTGDFTSGTADLTLEYASGSITGVVRVVGYTSDTEVDAVVVSDLGGTDSTENWEAGIWNDTDGYPTAVAFYEGRLWWAGRGRIWGSVSDSFTSFDPDFEGDAGPINRTLGDGATDKVNWLLPVKRLIAGSDSAEHSVRSTSFDELVTPSNFNVKEASTQGSASVPAIRMDGRGLFVQAGGTKVFETSFDLEEQDYTAADATALVPDIAGGGFIRMAVQRQPDTRIWLVRSDGKVALLVRDRAEDVLGWVLVETDGAIEDVVVVPGATDDRVFWTVARTVNGSTVRFHEEMSMDSESIGGSVSKLADAAAFYEGAATSTIIGLGHLEGESVVAWGGGKDLGTFTVFSGRITLSEPTTPVWVGLTYRARYKSAKLAVQLQTGMSLGQRSRIDHVGLILADTHAQGLKYGPDFENMDELPLAENGADVDTTSVWEAFDKDMIEFNGDWDTDSRICLEANAPRPATVMAAILNDERQEKLVR